MWWTIYWWKTLKNSCQWLTWISKARVPVKNSLYSCSVPHMTLWGLYVMWSANMGLENKSLTTSRPSRHIKRASCIVSRPFISILVDFHSGPVGRFANQPKSRSVVSNVGFGQVSNYLGVMRWGSMQQGKHTHHNFKNWEICVLFKLSARNFASSHSPSSANG